MVGEGDQVQVRRWFPATPVAVGQAREWVTRVAAATGHAPMTPTLQLLVSELATNAIRHAGGDRFLVEFDANGHVLVAVCDANPTEPTPRDAQPTDLGGRGLAIVEGLSERWGAQIHRDGKCVWFQLADSPADATKAR